MSTNFSKPFQPEKFQMSIGGDFGTFYTDSKSPVFYINTSFDINDIGNLKPVREILDISEVDFEELVQRDLDDFRIRRDIANYLTDGMGYKFFPPIVVAMTQPDEDKKAIKQYYPSVKARIIEGDNRKFEIEFEDSFCVRWFLDDANQLISLPTELRWKSEHTHLMAVDGQHRLVALQAIRGLINSERLQRFYQSIAKDKSKLDNLTVPVTILFFPNSVQEISPENSQILSSYFPNIDWNVSHRTDVKQVLRNIFVDVNKTAKQPSKSRTILLDEKDLTSVFTRKVFSFIKIDLPNIYTAVLEYNSLNGKETQIERNRSIITTIGIVYNIAEFLFKDQPIDTGSNLRTRLGIDNEQGISTTEEFPIEQLKSNEFSLEQRKNCENLFETKWLPAFKKLYTALLPYEKMIGHIESVYEEFQTKISNDTINDNEYEAYRVLFGGSEERFILESNAKNVTNTSSRISLKILKDLEKSTRDKVQDYNMFYTLMFQKGFFEALSDLIQNGFLESNHYASDTELELLIQQLNSFITKFPNTSFFDNNSVLYNLIVGTKASPDSSKYIGYLLVLIWLKFGKEANKFIVEDEENKDKIKELLNQKLELLENRISDSLGKEFEGRTENRQRKLEIKAQSESGDKSGAKVSQSQYQTDKLTYIDEHIKGQISALKHFVDL